MSNHALFIAGAATPDVFYTQGVGTTIYAAPEQLKGFDYNEKVKII